MDILSLKLILAAVLFVLAAFFGLLPLKVLKILRQRANRNGRENADQLSHIPSLIMCLLTCFTGGTFFGSSLLHLLPDTEENYKTLQDSYGISSSYPIPQLVSGYGFFLVYLVEEAILIIMRKTNSEMGHSHGQPPNRKDSIKESITSVDSKKPLVVGYNNEYGSVESFSQPSTELVPINVADCGHRISAEPECCEPEPIDQADDDPPIRMAAKPHDHLHGVRSITLLIALSFHSLIEGLALGISKNSQTTVSLFLSVVFHKCIVLFSLGIQLARTHAANKRLVIISIILLALMSPIGTGIGLGIEEASFNSKSKLIVEFVFNGISVGTFLYVTFFEILQHERDNEHPNYQKLIVMLVGFSIMAGLRVLED